MTAHNESEVDSLLMSPSCWSQSQTGSTHHHDQYMLDGGHKLLLDDQDLESLPSDSEVQKGSMDVLDNLIMNSQSLSTSLAELKPLPPFTGYTGHLSINGISGHHYHAIAQRMPEENNNYASHHNPYNNNHSNTDQNIVSSSTCLPDSVLNADTSDSCLQDVKLFSDNLDSKIYSVADSCIISPHGPDSASAGARIYSDAKELSEYVDMSSIDDIAAIIGSAIADTTVPSHLDSGDGNDSRDSWMDLDAWIDGNCVQPDGKLMGSQQESINEFILPHSPAQSSGGGSTSTLQNLLTQGYMPLLQNRLQNGPPIKLETPSSTSYCSELISTSTSPPGSVVSTTDNLLLNNRYLSAQHQHYQQLSMSNAMKSDALCSSPDLIGNYPHTTTSSTLSSQKNKRRAQKKQQQQQQLLQQQQQQSLSQQSASQLNMASATATVNFQNAGDLSGLLGKEKPVHRCNICNRGFLNKSNIKVHLRTHTGEKPFRCDVCSKAFRQKAHLIKHQQIHKRIGRD